MDRKNMFNNGRGRRMESVQRAQAEMARNDLVVGRNRLRYQETPPPSPDSVRPSLHDTRVQRVQQRGQQNGQQRRRDDRRQDRQHGPNRQVDQGRHRGPKRQPDQNRQRTQNRQRDFIRERLQNPEGDQIPQVDFELRAIISGLKVPPSIFDRLESRWLHYKTRASGATSVEEVEEVARQEMSQLDNTNRQLRASNDNKELEIARLWALNEEMMGQIEKLRAANSSMKKPQEKFGPAKQDRAAMDLKAERAARKEDTQLIKDLKQENEKLELENDGLKQDCDMAAGLLKFNTKAHQDKKVQMDRMSEDLASLREMVDAKDSVISTMDRNINAMAGASPDDTLRLALEAQAQRTLGMVQGLQAEVANMDTIIGNLHESIMERDATIESHKEQLKAIKEMEERATAADQRASEAQALAEQQQEIIKQLMSRQGSSTQFY